MLAVGKFWQTVKYKKKIRLMERLGRWVVRCVFGGGGGGGKGLGVLYP